MSGLKGDHLLSLPNTTSQKRVTDATYAQGEEITEGYAYLKA